MKKAPNPSHAVHPQAQVIITGKPLTPEQVAEVSQVIGDNFCVSNWIDSDGRIGHLDSLKPGTTIEQFKENWTKLTKFDYLDLGITLMNGPPGTPVFPVASYCLKNGRLSKQMNVHYLHPPPRRFKNHA
jgi:hypothetical protein